MNTSRDIEKLFDHFGGNADDYQEIGRENEAKTARTRWPLLATLDFAQPAIPEIATRRDGQLNAPRTHVPASDEQAEPALTPINRGKPPLFARAHRRAIPPVDSKATVDEHRASRFGSPADDTAPAEIVQTAPTPVPPPVVAPVQQPQPVQQPAQQPP
ncbi:cellulose biosynthesis protein BcsP [Candidatus Burkholderia verschuerenii]|uniref:cellulose biosynthesis protein BcsP n=1 Tax=Candidatus Burkholderia verschuerenii TaxID=242163 RepID=UPI00067AB97F|nr:cellulose biosynthesis protein BcsP [Candidatus Burkholderia verschuerenii]